MALSLGSTSLQNSFAGKNVLITGNTGFKGSWLTAWLLKLGANIVGYSISVPTMPSMFIDAGLESRVNHIFGDVTDLKRLNSVIKECRPDFIFHLAAQAIVSTSYENPVETMNTNFMGTVNVLDCLRKIDHPCIAIMITSDKCYENVEWIWGYKETDQIGGKDIYSGSKGAAEIAFHSYYESFFKNNENVKIATGRAGNVIGGGDWAKDRIVVDCIRNWMKGEKVQIRSPEATRPWQHVLEPISGYLTLGASLVKDKSLSGESFNFGPMSERSHTVVNVIEDLYKHVKSDTNVSLSYEVVNRIPFLEAGLLRLNCEKSLFKLNWASTLKYEECMNFVGKWYKDYMKDKQSAYTLTIDQIALYEGIAKKRGAAWAHYI